MTSETTEKKRAYTRITPEIEGTILAYRERFPTMSYGEIAEETGYAYETVRYVIGKLPKLRRLQAGEEQTATSLRSRILEALAHLGEVNSIPEMRRILGQADDEHNIVHVLNSLNKSNEINFTRYDGGRKYRNIRLAKHGNGPSRIAVAHGVEEANHADP